MTIESTTPPGRMVVQLHADELETMIERAVARAMRNNSKPPAPRASDRLTLAEFCKAYRCSVRTAQRMIAAQLLRVEKRTDSGSSRVFVARSELDRLLAESRK